VAPPPTPPAPPPSGKPTGACWTDGRLVEPGQPSILADDHAVVTGDGVFETMKVVGGTPFALTRHLRRLENSAAGLGIPAVGERRVRAAVDEVLAADPTAGLLRITWSSGSGPLGSARGGGNGTLVVATSAGNDWPPAEAVHLVEWRRNEHGALTGLKTTSYAENALALATAKRAGCSEAIFRNVAGDLCEGTGTNLFLVVGGVPTTPPLSSGCLAGVTRELLLEALHDEVEVRDLAPDELHAADEAFLTSSTRNVSPISAVTGVVEVTFDPAPGPVTSRAMEAFASVEAASMDP